MIAIVCHPDDWFNICKASLKDLPCPHTDYLLCPIGGKCSYNIIRVQFIIISGTQYLNVCVGGGACVRTCLD